MKIVLYADKKDCCGCAACQSVCPLDCITMKADSQGFLYPVTDESKCIMCRKCIAVCPLK